MVRVSTADQCMYGLQTWAIGSKPRVPARKRIRLMTNCYHIFLKLGRRCDGTHRHQELIGGRAREAAKYPEALCRAICEGLRNQLEEEEHGVRHLLSVSHNTSIGELAPDDDNATENSRRDRGVAHEEEDGQCGQAWDDITGECVDPREVRKARAVWIDNKMTIK